MNTSAPRLQVCAHADRSTRQMSLLCGHWSQMIKQRLKRSLHSTAQLRLGPVLLKEHMALLQFKTKVMVLKCQISVQISPVSDKLN